jgi:hypothetical protein
MKRDQSWYRILVIVGALAAAAAPIPAAGEQPDPSGTWQLRVNRPGRPPSDTTLKLQKTGAKVVGVLTDNQGRATPINDGQVKDGELSFRISTERQGQKITILYKGKLTGETLKGQASISLFGQNRGFDFEGKRVKEEATLTGSWKIALVLGSGQKLQPTLQLQQQGDRVTGTYLGVSGKEVRLRDLTVKNGELTFRVPDELEEDKLTFEYAGKLAGDALRGTVRFVSNNQPVTLKFEATRVPSPNADVAGTWKFRVPLKEGPTFEPTVKLVQEGSALSGTYIGEQGATPVADALIFGDELTFEVARDRDGKKYRLRYQAKVRGDSIKGVVDYDFDGMAGSLDFEGKRLARPAQAAGKNP